LYKQRRAGKRKPWLISVTFIILYSVIRFLLEYLRQDSQSEHIWPLTTTQWFMILFLGFGFALWFMYEEED
jgi:prolipoprotein diacylglyceryltransferase